MSERLDRLIKIINTSNDKSNIIRTAKILLENYGEEIPMNELMKLIPLIKILDFSKDPNLRRLIDKALRKRFDEETYKGLIDLMNSEDELNRVIGVEHIRNFKRVEILPYLIKILEDEKENIMIRRNAAWAMRGIEDPRIHETLVAIENKEIDYNLRIIVEAVRKDYEENFIN